MEEYEKDKELRRLATTYYHSGGKKHQKFVEIEKNREILSANELAKEIRVLTQLEGRGRSEELALKELEKQKEAADPKMQDSSKKEPPLNQPPGTIKLPSSLPSFFEARGDNKDNKKSEDKNPVFIWSYPNKGDQLVPLNNN